MLRQRSLTIWIGLILVVSIIVPILWAGFSSLNKADFAEQNNDYQQAAGEYARAARFLFWRGDLYEKAGVSAAQAGAYSDAISYLQKNTDLSEEGWFWLCTSYIQAGEDSSALKACNAGVKVYASARLYKLQAYIFRKQKDWSAERVALVNQTLLDQKDAFAAYRLGLLSVLYAPKDAIPELTRASTLNPEVDSAVQTLRAALAIADQKSDPSTQKVILGQAFGLVQDWELALTAFEQAVQLEETNAEAWAWLGEAKQQTGQDGSVELDKALSLNRNSVNVHALRGLYWSRKEKYEQMLAEYLLAEGIEPENPRWQVSIGEAYSKLGDQVKALESYQKAVSLAPAQADYWRLLALFCAENNVQLDEIGLPAAQQALALSPNDPITLDALGYVYLSSGQYAIAEETLKLAISISPEYFPAHLHLALAYLSQGDRTSAYNSLIYVRDAQGAGVYSEAARQLLDKYFQ